jgi:hypothetical protein
MADAGAGAGTLACGESQWGRLIMGGAVWRRNMARQLALNSPGALTPNGGD